MSIWKPPHSYIYYQRKRCKWQKDTYYRRPSDLSYQQHLDLWRLDLETNNVVVATVKVVMKRKFKSLSWTAKRTKATWGHRR